MESVTKTRIAESDLGAICQALLGSTLVASNELKEGWFNTAFDMSLADGRRVVIKIAPPDSVKVMRYEKGILESEVRSMQMVKSQTTVPVPEILAYDQSRKLINQDFYIMEFLPGVPLSECKEALSAELLGKVKRRVGEILGQVNSLTGSAWGMFGGPTFESWPQAFAHLMSDVIQDGIDAGVPMPYDRMGAVASRLNAALRPVVNPCLVHWDLWEGNVFVIPETGEVTGVIDFERCLWADPLMEQNFMDPSPEFLEGYGPDPGADAYAATRRKLYSLHLFTIMVVEGTYRQVTDLTWVNWGHGKFDELLPELEAMPALL